MSNLIGRLGLCLATALLTVSLHARAQQASDLPNVPAIQLYHPSKPSPAAAAAEQACGWAKTAKARIAGCTRVIREASDSQAKAAAFDNRGNEKAAIGDFDGAMADFNEANRWWPEFEGPYIDRAMVRIEQRDAAGAILEYDGLIKLDSADSVGFDGRCWARALANLALDAALSDCDRAIKISPYDAVSYEDRAIVWFRRGEMSRVVSDTNFALDQSPSSVRARYLRGLAKLALGQIEDGRADMTAARTADAAAIDFLVKWGLKP